MKKIAAACLAAMMLCSACIFDDEWYDCYDCYEDDEEWFSAAPASPDSAPVATGR